MSLESIGAVNVFFSYSHRDEELRDALEVHLALMKRQGLIHTWHDRRIGAGREWEGEIDARLESADRDEAFLDVARGIRSVIEKWKPPSKLSTALEKAYEKRAELAASGKNTRAIDETIVGLKREIREDGHLKKGDFLLDGRFRLQEMIGQGGFAQVWRAFDRERASIVAVKVLTLNTRATGAAGNASSAALGKCLACAIYRSRRTFMDWG